MLSNYFNVEVKPIMTPIAAGLHASFEDGDVLFDWTAFEIPRGPARLIGVTAEIRPKGNANADPNAFGFELLFAKSKNLIAPTTLGALNSAPAALTDIEGQVNRYIGHMPIIGGDFGVTDQLAVASTNNDSSIVLQGEPNSGNTKGTDTLYVGGIAGGAFDFTSLTRINNGDLNGPTMTVNGTDPRLHIAKGDTVAVTTALNTSITKAMGVVDSMTSTTIVLTEAFTTGDVVHTDFVYNTSPIKLILHFEK